MKGLRINGGPTDNEDDDDGTASSVTVKVRDRDECLRRVCDRLSERWSKRCRDEVFCSLKGDCPSPSGVCLCRVRGGCLQGGNETEVGKQNDFITLLLKPFLPFQPSSLKHNVSHLLLPSLPQGSSEATQGFEIVSVEATTLGRSSDYQDLAGEAGRKPFIKSTIQRWWRKKDPHYVT